MARKRQTRRQKKDREILQRGGYVQFDDWMEQNVSDEGYNDAIQRRGTRKNRFGKLIIRPIKRN